MNIFLKIGIFFILISHHFTVYADSSGQWLQFSRSVIDRNCEQLSGQERVICEWISDKKHTDLSRLKRWEKNLQETPQIGGNFSSHYFSSFLNGLISGEMAVLYFEKIKESDSTVNRSQYTSLFCEERKKTLVNFESIDWRYFRVNFEGDTKNSIMLSMNKTFSYLNEKLNKKVAYKLCSLDASDTKKDFQVEIKRSIHSSISWYFEGSTSPISALIGDKVKISGQVLQEAEATADELEKKIHDELMPGFNQVKKILGQIQGRVDPMFESYQNSVLEARNILEEREGVEKGLLYDEVNQKDLRGDLEKRYRELLDSASQSNASLNTLNQLDHGNSELEEKKTLFNLCKVYLCRVLHGDRSSEKICNLNSGNPLCDPSLNWFPGGSNIGLADLCKSVGVETEMKFFINRKTYFSCLSQAFKG